MKLFKREPMPEASAPSPEFSSPAEAIAFLVAAQRGIDGSWATLEGESRAGTQAAIQVADETVNLLLEETDLAAVLEGLGLTALASIAAKGGRREDDPTLWRLPDATPEEIAAVVDALFAQHFGLGEGYRLRGWVEN